MMETQIFINVSCWGKKNDLQLFSPDYIVYLEMDSKVLFYSNSNYELHIHTFAWRRQLSMLTKMITNMLFKSLARKARK